MGQAFAADECGVDVAGASTTTCNAATSPTGIDYTITDAADFTLDINNAATTVGPVADQGSIVWNAGLTGSITINGNFATITTTGTNSYGLYSNLSDSASTGLLSTITLSTGAISTTGLRATGVFTAHRGTGDSIITMTGGSVTTSAESARGLHSAQYNTAANALSQTTMSAGSISTTDRAAIGIEAEVRGTGSALGELTGGSITTTGETGYGIWSVASSATSSASLLSRLSNGSIDTEGKTAYGLYADHRGLGPASAIQVSGTISTIGEDASGIRSSAPLPGSTAMIKSEIQGGSVTVSGLNSHGLDAETAGTGSVVAAASGASVVTANGADADGIRTTITQAASIYDVNVNDTAKVTGGSGTGAGIHTVSVADSTGTIDIAAGATVDGATNGGEAIVDDAGNVTANVNGTVSGKNITLGDGSDNLNINAGSNIAGVTVALDGGDDTAIADGFIDILTLTGQSLSKAGSYFLNWEQMTLATGTTVTLTDGALTVGADAGQGLTVASGGTLNQSGIAATTITGNVNNAAGGTITTQNGSVGETVTITGDYSAGGALLVDTVLDDGAGGSDAINITGNATGTTTVNVTNVGGTGAATTGDGILVVTTGGTGTFALYREVRAGDYVYNLVQVGNNWYLQSSLSPVLPVPTLSAWGLALLSGLMGLVGFFGRRKMTK